MATRQPARVLLTQSSPRATSTHRGATDRFTAALRSLFSSYVRCDEVDDGHGQLGSMSVHFTSRGKATMTPRFRNAVAALALLSAQASAQEQPLTTKCELAPLMAAFTVFSETGRMPPNLVKFIGDAALQKIEPYKAFDNVYYVGICWVSAWLITSPNGHVLIDTLYGPYTEPVAGKYSHAGVRSQGHQAGCCHPRSRRPCRRDWPTQIRPRTRNTLRHDTRGVARGQGRFQFRAGGIRGGRG